MFVGMSNGNLVKVWPAIFLAIFCFVCPLTSAQEENTRGPGLNATHSVAALSFKITAKIYENSSLVNRNVLFSPVSVLSHVSAVARLIAKEETSWLTGHFYIVPGYEHILAEFEDIVKLLKNDENFTFDISDKVHVNNGTLFEIESPQIVHTSLFAVQVNHWEQGNSNVTAEDLKSIKENPPSSVLVIVNSFNFTGEWATKFDKANTKSEPFFVTPTETKEVQMMHLTSDGFHFLNSEELDCKMIELPYKGDKVSLVLLLPNKVDGLADLESKLATLDLNQLLKRTDKHLVTVSLPKFRIGHSVNASDTDMTQVDIAFFAACEEGTEGVAETDFAHEGRNESHSAVPNVFRADHPFMFVLLERWTQMIFFFGSVSNP